MERGPRGAVMVYFEVVICICASSIGPKYSSLGVPILLKMISP